VSAKFELDNGKLKEYRTFWIDLGDGVSLLGRPCHTKCGLSFKEKEDACDHLDCAVDAARTEALYLAKFSGVLALFAIVLTWYDMGDLLAAVRGTVGTFIKLVPLIILISVFPFKRWLELREYRNHGTIHGRRACRL
jgi:hypothetical protein